MTMNTYHTTGWEDICNPTDDQKPTKPAPPVLSATQIATPSPAQPPRRVFTGVVGKNADLIAAVAALYLPPQGTIADVTFGKGNFWKKVDLTPYEFRPSDIKPRHPEVLEMDFRRLTYCDASVDVVVFDPPYAHNPGAMLVDSSYHNAATTSGMYHADIMELCRQGMKEASRVLKAGGLLWVKCQDEIEASRQRWSHMEIWQIARDIGFDDQDLFVLVQASKPCVQNKRQLHARKNHSYLWVFRR